MSEPFSATMRELVALGASVGNQHPDLQGAALPSAGYGEEVVGTMVPDELALFLELHEANNDLEHRTRTLLSDALTRAGAAIRGADLSQSLHDLLANGGPVDFVDDATRKAYWQLNQRIGMLHTAFHWTLGDRLGLHDWRLGIRAGGKVVKVMPR